MSDTSKWIEFIETEPKPSTKVWSVRAKEGGNLLGQVKWFGRWRRYSFFPNLDVQLLVFEQQCLRDIAAFIEERTTEHRQLKVNSHKER